MDFRQIEKEDLPIMIPIDLVTEVRVMAARERRSLSEVTSELLCKALGRDPREFGIDPTRAKRHATANA